MQGRLYCGAQLGLGNQKPRALRWGISRPPAPQKSEVFKITFSGSGGRYNVHLPYRGDLYRYEVWLCGHILDEHKISTFASCVHSNFVREFNYSRQILQDNNKFREISFIVYVSVVNMFKRFRT